MVNGIHRVRAAWIVINHQTANGIQEVDGSIPFGSTTPTTSQSNTSEPLKPEGRVPEVHCLQDVCKRKTPTEAGAQGRGGSELQLHDRVECSGRGFVLFREDVSIGVNRERDRLMTEPLADDLDRNALIKL